MSPLLGNYTFEYVINPIIPTLLPQQPSRQIPELFGFQEFAELSGHERMRGDFGFCHIAFEDPVTLSGGIEEVNDLSALTRDKSTDDTAVFFCQHG